MKVLNYREVLRRIPPRWTKARDYRVTVHKYAPPLDPRVSFVLLDWECRERFTAVEFLAKQDVPRDTYELIWVELYDRVIPEIIDQVDVFITLSQCGMYHKHVGYNVAHLHASGEILTVCDSDAVFPRNFVTSVLRSFKMEDQAPPIPLVLMHHQWRTSQTYPEGLNDPDVLHDERWGWWPLIPNAGACMSVRREDVTRFGGFDEHPSFRGYLCGPYDLAWRMVNAGWPEVWHDTSVALWHFAHPDPVGTNGLRPVWRLLLENTFPHVDLHAISAVDAFSTGRISPLQENLAIWHLRMRSRYIGTKFEEKYAQMTSQHGFAPSQIRTMRRRLICDLLFSSLHTSLRSAAETYMPAPVITLLRSVKTAVRRALRRRPGGDGPANPILVNVLSGYNVIEFGDRYYGLPQRIGPVDFSKPENLKRSEILVASTRRRVERAIHIAVISEESRSPALQAPRSLG